MNNNEFGEASLGNEKIQLSAFAKKGIMQSFYFAVSALMASASQKELFSPLGIAFCSGISKEYTLFSCLGAMLGYIVSNEYLSAFRYVMSLILVYVLKAYIGSFPKLRDKNLIPPLISFFSTSSTGIIMLFTTPFSSQRLFFHIAESLTSFGGAYFITVASKSIEKIKSKLHITNREMTATVMTVFLFILSLSRIEIFSVSLSGIFCSYMIMCASFLFREQGGAVIGTSAALGFSMIGNSSAVVFCYSVAGLFSGIFSYSGRFLCSMAYIFSYGAAFLFFGGTASDLSPLIETAAASVIFLLTPQKVFLQAKEKLSFSSLSEDEAAIRDMMLLRLKMVKIAVTDMSGAVSRVSALLKEKAAPDKTGVYLRVRDKVCSDCATFDKCWKSGLSVTLNEYDAIIDIIRKTGSITPSSSPSTLQNRCIRIMSLCDSFNKNYSAYSARLGAEGRINEMRKITADQFETVCGMIDDLLYDFQSDIKPKAAKSGTIKDSLEDIGVSAFVNCYEDEEAHTFINLTVKSSCAADEKEIKECLENVTEKYFADPAVIKNDTEKILMFWERPLFAVDCGYFQMASDESDICGDCFDSFYDGKGNFIAVLSDGMGTGSRAAIDGAMTSSIFSKLIISGFSFPCALRLVNSAMLVKSREESLATLDILKVNLYNGQAAIYKAGATVSLMKRMGKVSEIKKSAMPIGILRQAEFAIIRGNVKSGDLLVLMSDGAADNNVAEMKSFIAENTADENLSQKLCALAKSRTVTRCDDITVATVKIKPNV